jgi:hypothetical protein
MEKVRDRSSVLCRECGQRLRPTWTDHVEEDAEATISRTGRAYFYPAHPRRSGESRLCLASGLQVPQRDARGLEVGPPEEGAPRPVVRPIAPFPATAPEADGAYNTRTGEGDVRAGVTMMYRSFMAGDLTGSQSRSAD